MVVSTTLLTIFGILHGCGACLNGYVRFDDSCYHISRETENWIDSMTTCRLDNGYLAEITSSRENEFLKNQLSVKSVSAGWIGANDLNAEGNWMFGYSKERVSYTNWDSGEPNNARGQQCGALRSSGRWDDSWCHDQLNYICEMPYDSQHEIVG